jgi:hypothetical protein
LLAGEHKKIRREKKEKETDRWARVALGGRGGGGGIPTKLRPRNPFRVKIEGNKETLLEWICSK